MGKSSGVEAKNLLGGTLGVDILFGSNFGSRLFIVNILHKLANSPSLQYNST
jgi:hypothetical protein